MKDKLYVLFGTAVSRAFPIVNGIIVLHYYSPLLFSQFVYILSIANVVIGACTLAICPQILGSNNYLKQACPIGRAGFFLSLIIGTLTFILLPKGIISGDFKLFAWLYFVASMSCNIGQALLNSRRLFAKAFGLTVFASITPLMLSIALLEYNKHELADPSFLFIAIPYGVLSVIFYFFVAYVNSPGLSNVLPSLRSLGFRAVNDGFFSGLFGLSTLSGLYILNKNSIDLGSDSYKVCFALAFQLFSITIFVPGALGSYFVPNIASYSSLNDIKNRISSLTKTYTLFGIGLCFFVAISLPALFRYYHVPLNFSNYAVVAVLQIAAVVAGFNAALNQFFVVVASYRTIFFISFSWLLILALCAYVIFPAPPLTSVSLLVAYGISTFFAYMAFNSWNYITARFPGD